MTLIVEQDAHQAATLAFALGENTWHLDSLSAVEAHLAEHHQEMLVVVGPNMDFSRALAMSARWQVERPLLGMVLLRHRVDVQLMAQALRAGVREVVGPEDLAAVVAAARRSIEVSQRRAAALYQGSAATGYATGPANSRGRIITVFSAKGGCGKTTVATNLAAVLASDGTRVALVDLDLEFGDVAIALQLLPHRTIVDLLPMVGTMDEAGVRSVMTAVQPGLDTMLAPTSPGQASKVTPALVSELLGVLRSMYDVVIIDTPPAMTEQVLAAFDLSDVSVLLATLDIPALKNLKVALDTLDLLGYPRASRVIVLNRADAQVGLDRGDVQHAIAVPVSVHIPSSGDVPASINRGRLIVSEQPAHPVSQALRELAVQVAPSVAGQFFSAPVSPTPPVSSRSGLRVRLRREGVR